MLLRLERAAGALASALLAVLFVACPSAGDAQSQGPYPSTVLSRGGTLIWYVGQLPVAGHTWRELDDICGSVPIPQVPGWRAPSENELRSLMVGITKRNAVTSWVEWYLIDEQLFVPTIPRFNPGNRNPKPVNLLTRDLYAYNGLAITKEQVAPGQLYVIKWFNRSTQQDWDLEQTITPTPLDYRLGNNERLLCVSDRPRQRR